MTTNQPTTDPFAAAERVAPQPDSRDHATRATWIRHYAAQSVAAHVAFRHAIHTLPSNPEPGSRPELGYLMAVAVAATTATAALADPDLAPGLIWDLTPEAGALNGEWEDWLYDTLAAHGVNPADLDPDLDPADFADTVAAATVSA